MKRLLLFTLSGCLLSACNSYKSKLRPLEEESVSPASIDYQFVHLKVIEPYCLRCHNPADGNKGDVNLESYEDVMAHLRGIEETVLVDESMPPRRAGGPLAEYEKTLLKTWIEAGAPFQKIER